MIVKTRSIAEPLSFASRATARVRGSPGLRQLNKLPSQCGRNALSFLAGHRAAGDLNLHMPRTFRLELLNSQFKGERNPPADRGTERLRKPFGAVRRGAGDRRLRRLHRFRSGKRPGRRLLGVVGRCLLPFMATRPEIRQATPISSWLHRPTPILALSTAARCQRLANRP